MSNYLIHYAKGYEKDEHKYVAKEYYNGRWHYYYDDDKLDEGDSISYPVGERASNHDSIRTVRTVTGYENQTLADPFLEIGGNAINSGRKFVEKKLEKLASSKKKKENTANVK